MKMIKTLKEILSDLDTLSVKKGEYYFKLIELDLAGSTGEVQDPRLISNSILITREKFEEHLEMLKVVSDRKF
jgi:hypothetical protein